MGGAHPTGLAAHHVVALAIPPGIRDVHETCATFIASIKRLASRIDASISRIGTAMSASMEATVALERGDRTGIEVVLEKQHLVVKGGQDGSILASARFIARSS